MILYTTVSRSCASFGSVSEAIVKGETGACSVNIGERKKKCVEGKEEFIGMFIYCDSFFGCKEIMHESFREVLIGGVGISDVCPLKIYLLIF